MRAVEFQKWIEHLRHVASPAARTDVPLGLGELEPPFRAAVCDGAVPPARLALPPRGECGAWWSRFDDRIDVAALLAAPEVGHLLPRDTWHSIEAWTDAELCTLHALWRNRADLDGRIEAARDWHLENTQPDNATNRPWALHVFLLAGTPESVHYAETLLHNTLAYSGRPEALSAWILMDAAKELEVVSGEW